jgi:hypothetical protein
MERYYSGLANLGIQFHRGHKRPRAERFKYLESLGFQTPLHGTVVEVVNRIKRGWLLDLETHTYSTGCLEVVVYAGQYKQAMSLDRALEDCPESYSSEFIERGKESSLSHEFIQIGNRRWLVEWQSPDHYDSRNTGVGRILAELEEGYHPQVKLPAFGIEFVPGDHLWAVDFNPAPEIQNTPIADVLTPQEFANLVLSAQRKFQGDSTVA